LHSDDSTTSPETGYGTQFQLSISNNKNTILGPATSLHWGKKGAKSEGRLGKAVGISDDTWQISRVM
jgi:hypothetical protein